MKTAKTLPRLAKLLAALSLSTSALLISSFASADSPSSATPPHAMPSSSMDTQMRGGTMDMKAMMKEDMDSMASMQMTGNPDVDFAMMMRNHHLSGIKMAEIELRDGKEPKMRTVAKSIIAQQKKEIAKFDQFLVKHGHSAKSGKK